MTPSRLVAVLCLGLALPACDDTPPDPAWASGAVLLDALADVRILDEDGRALDGLPVDVTGGPGALEVVIESGQWRRAALTSPPAHPIPEGAVPWEAEPFVHLWLGNERPL